MLKRLEFFFIFVQNWSIRYYINIVEKQKRGINKMKKLFSTPRSQKGDCQMGEDAEPPDLSASYSFKNQIKLFQENNCLSKEDSFEMPLLERPIIKNISSRDRVYYDLRSSFFRKKFFPNATSVDWNNWKWQLSNRITTLEKLNTILKLSDDELSALENHGISLPVSMTPYYTSLLDPNKPEQPLRRSVMPVISELIKSDGEAEDPLHEENDSPVPCIVHRYQDRVLFLVTNYCSTYCRYCTRSRIMKRENNYHSDIELWKKAISYIEANPVIRDVLLSGGDPLTLPDDRLEWLLGSLRAIPHVELIRIGTKTPTVLPQRITSSLIKILKKFHPLFISIHFTHPDELTNETTQACSKLADAGLPLGSQTVLLKGINDDIDTMKRLMHGLVKRRVKPYYLYQCDPIIGSSHFRTPVTKGIEIMRGLYGHTSGYAVPTYVIDAPGGGGKIPILPNSIVGKEGDDLILKNHNDLCFKYPDYAKEI